MENKCNKTPNNSCNNNQINSKYMDHVYCHSNQTKSTYSINNNVTTAGSVGSGGAATSPNADILALLKENKQLKSMLILHLNLIQEQSDQLMAKEKTLITCNEELDTLRGHIAALQNQVKDLQKQLQRQIKRSGEISTLPPPPLAKIQCQPVTTIATALVPMAAANGDTVVASKNIIGECNGKLISKIVLQRVNMPSLRRNSTQSPLSQTSDTENDDEAEEEYDDEDEDEDEDEEEIDGEDIDDEEEDVDDVHLQENLDQEDDAGHLDEIGVVVQHSEESMDEKSNSQTVIIDDLYDTGNTTEDSNEVLAVQSKRLRLRQAAKQSLTLPRGAKPSVSPASTTTNDGQTAFKAVTSSTSSSSTTAHVSKQPPTPSRGKQMTMMRWHATEYNTDESVSCDSTADNERHSTSATSSSPLKHATNVTEKKRSYENLSHHPHPRAKIRRCTYISTPQLYSTREWEDETFGCDYDNEFLKAEAKLSQSDNPKLEIPKWTEHDLTPSYCIEGTEDLSDEIFLKRHAKLEVDEKRRKKWDVQQIREQRRIERLKRRHCKDELQPSQDAPCLQTFYPTTDNLQTICFVHDIPVQAFGEMIPRLTAMAGVGEHRNFLLPWLDKEQLQILNENNKQPTVAIVNTLEATTSALTQQMFNSTFVLLKKRRRQQSSSFGPLHNLTSRQRNLAAKMNNTNTSSTTSFPTTVTPTTTNTTNMTLTTSAQTFLNVVSSTYTSTFTASPVTTATVTAMIGSSSLNVST